MTKQTQTDSALALGFGKDWFQKLQAKAKYNIYQAEYYDRMAEDYHDELFHRKARKDVELFEGLAFGLLQKARNQEHQGDHSL